MLLEWQEVIENNRALVTYNQMWGDSHLEQYVIPHERGVAIHAVLSPGLYFREEIRNSITKDSLSIPAVAVCNGLYDFIV